jgi:hypothetical protein
MSLDKFTQDYHTRLEKWTNFLGLPKTEPQRTEVDFILNLDKNGIGKLTNVQLSEYCVVLNQYAFFLQQKANESQTFLNWAKSVKNMIARDDLHRLMTLEREIGMRLSRVSYLSRRIETIAQSFTNLVRARYGERKIDGTN